MPITSTNPGGVIPEGYLKQRLTLSALEIGEVISGLFTEAGVPGTALTHTIASTDVTTATASLETAIDAHAAAGVGTAWAAVTVDNGTTYLDVFSLDTDGELLFSSTPPGGSEVTTKIWTGNSVARAQVTTLTPLNVLTGDTFTVKINGKAISVTATADTAANVATLLQAAIEASAIPEWREVVATVSGDVVTLTALTAGVPFTVTGSSTDSVGVEITTTTAGSAGTSSQQSFAVPKSAAGTFTVTFGDQTTSALAIGVSANDMRTALYALSTIGSPNITVNKADSSDGNDDVYTVTFQGLLAATPVATFLVDVTSTKPIIRTTQQGGHSGTVRNEIQTIDLGAGAGSATYTLTLDGNTTVAIAADASAETVQTAITGPSNIQQVAVTKSGYVYTVEFLDIDGSANQSQMTASVLSASSSFTKRLTTTTTAGVASVNEVQKVATQGTATGGTFTLTYSGQTTSAIAYNASTATVQSAIEALSNIGSGDVAVTGSAGAWIVTFQGALAATNVTQMTASSSLTGTAAANVTVTTTTSSAGPNHWDTADNWLPSGVPVNGDDVRFELGNVDCLYGLDQSGVTLDSLWVMMGYSGSIGLPRINESDYIEYRTRELTIGATEIRVGDGEEGSGPRKVALNTGTVTTTITVKNSGDSSESNVPCVIWRGDNVSNLIYVDSGDFGCSWWSDESSRFSTLVQRGGTVFLRYATIVDEVLATNQQFRAWQCTLGTKPFNV